MWASRLWIGSALAGLAAATLAEGASASPFRPLPGPAPGASEAGGKRGTVADLPYARGRSFASLDEYLEFRRRGGAMDLPWYKEVAPDVFELQTSIRPAPPPRRFTRAELAAQFGFAR